MVRFIGTLALVGCVYFRTPAPTPMVEVSPEEQRPAPPPPPSGRRVLLAPGLVVLGIGAALIAVGVPLLLDERRASAERQAQDAAYCRSHDCGFSINIDFSTMGGATLIGLGTVASATGLVLTIVGATGHK